MWLRRLVGIMMVLAFIVMNGVTVWGLAVPKKEVKPAVDISASSQATIEAPKIDFTADPV